MTGEVATSLSGKDLRLSSHSGLASLLATQASIMKACQSDQPRGSVIANVRFAHWRRSIGAWVRYPLARVRLSPPPGMAEEHHILEIAEREDRLCELVDGVLIEKDMASFESHVAMVLSYFLMAFLDDHESARSIAFESTSVKRPSNLTN